jgi:hypothetical protein
MIQEDRKELLKHALGATALILLIQTLVAAHFGIFDGLFHDPNCYSWLTRVLHLHETGSWFNARIPRIDPPYGLEQHWTRPFDVLLFIGAWIGAPLVGFKNALYAWGVLISPTLQIFAVIAFFWALLPLFSNRQIFVLGVLFVFQIVIILSFKAGRPDHQSLLYLLFIVSLGFGARLLLQPFRLRWCYGAGFASALALWVSVESLLVILMNLLCLGLFWLLEDDDFEVKLFHYSLSLFLGSAAALLAQRGFADLLIPELDQISIAFVVVSVALVVAVMEFLYPGFFWGPGANVDELYRQVRMQHIGEAQPLFLGGWKGGLSRCFSFLGIAIPTIPVLVYHLVKRRNPDMRFWAYVSIGLLIFGPRAFLHVRWVTYVGILLLPGYAWLVSRVVEGVETRVSRRRVLLLRPLIILICATWYMLPALLLVQKNIDADWRTHCPLPSLSRYLDSPAEWGDRPRDILTWADFGSELLYRTKHSVYSIANHRFQRGFTDSYNIMSASTDRQALEVIRERKVDLVLICTTRENELYVRENGQETFYDRISKGKTPSWIREVSLPDDIPGDFRLYEVRLP